MLTSCILSCPATLVIPTQCYTVKEMHVVLGIFTNPNDQRCLLSSVVPPAAGENVTALFLLSSSSRTIYECHCNLTTKLVYSLCLKGEAYGCSANYNSDIQSLMLKERH